MKGGAYVGRPRGLALLNFIAWIRRRPALGKMYRKLPLAWRVGAAGLLAAPAKTGARFPGSDAWSRPLQAVRERPLKRVGAGNGVAVNILGYVRGQFGLAESARLFASALIESGADVSLYDIDLGLPHGWEDRSLDAWISEELPHPISIIFVNPDHLDAALEKVGRERLRGKHLIACWFWELEKVPVAWLPAIDEVDEILVPSRFIEDAFRRVTDKPLLRVSQPLAHVADSGLSRADFGIEEGKFVFLATFDFHSWIERKNPFAAVEAFIRAFPQERDDVCLMVKSSNGHLHTESFRRLLNRTAADPRIVVRDQIIEREHVKALQRCCDAYVSLHRAEGFGLGLAESMSLGKPVIGTAWSGNLDFMTEDNSCLVRYQQVSVGEGEYPGAEGCMWAEPDLDDAARHMRRLVDEPGLALRLGAKAAKDIERTHSSLHAGTELAKRLRSLMQQEKGDEALVGHGSAR